MSDQLPIIRGLKYDDGRTRFTHFNLNRIYIPVESYLSNAKNLFLNYCSCFLSWIQKASLRNLLDLKKVHYIKITHGFFPHQWPLKLITDVL